MCNDPTLGGDHVSGNGLWRLLILDRDETDPKWILATVACPGDVRPARASDNAADEVTAAWLAAVTDLHRPALTPMPAVLVWRIDEHRS